MDMSMAFMKEKVSVKRSNFGTIRIIKVLGQQNSGILTILTVYRWPKVKNIIVFKVWNTHCCINTISKRMLH